MASRARRGCSFRAGAGGGARRACADRHRDAGTRAGRRAATGLPSAKVSRRRFLRTAGPTMNSRSHHPRLSRSCRRRDARHRDRRDELQSERSRRLWHRSCGPSRRARRRRGAARWLNWRAARATFAVWADPQKPNTARRIISRCACRSRPAASRCHRCRRRSDSAATRETLRAARDVAGATSNAKIAVARRTRPARIGILKAAAIRS